MVHKVAVSQDVTTSCARYVPAGSAETLVEVGNGKVLPGIRQPRGSVRPLGWAGTTPSLWWSGPTSNCMDRTHRRHGRSRDRLRGSRCPTARGRRPRQQGLRATDEDRPRCTSRRDRRPSGSGPAYPLAGGLSHIPRITGGLDRGVRLHGVPRHGQPDKDHRPVQWSDAARGLDASRPGDPTRCWKGRALGARRARWPSSAVVRISDVGGTGPVVRVGELDSTRCGGWLLVRRTCVVDDVRPSS